MKSTLVILMLTRLIFDNACKCLGNSKSYLKNEKARLVTMLVKEAQAKNVRVPLQMRKDQEK